MAVRARFVVEEVALHTYDAKVRLRAVIPADPGEQEEIKQFFTSTPVGEFQANIRNEVAAEQFQPGDQWYLTLEKVPKGA